MFSNLSMPLRNGRRQRCCQGSGCTKWPFPLCPGLPPSQAPSALGPAPSLLSPMVLPSWISALTCHPALICWLRGCGPAAAWPHELLSKQLVNKQTSQPTCLNSWTCNLGQQSAAPPPLIRKKEETEENSLLLWRKAKLSQNSAAKAFSFLFF